MIELEKHFWRHFDARFTDSMDLTSLLLADLFPVVGRFNRWLPKKHEQRATDNLALVFSLFDSHSQKKIECGSQNIHR
jgi:hypothetical protein